MPEQPMDTSHLKSQQPNFTPEAGSASALAPKFHALFLGLLAAAREGAILGGQAEPHRECSMAVSGDSVAW